MAHNNDLRYHGSTQLPISKVNKCCKTCAHCVSGKSGNYECLEYDHKVVVIQNYKPTDDHNKCNGKMWEQYS